MDDELFIGGRLRLARQRRGWNKTRLAKATKVTTPTITAYEDETRTPPNAFLERASEVLNFPTSFFFVDATDTVPLNAASFRALSRMSASQRDAALASGTMAVELHRWIAERFDLPIPDVPQVDPNILDASGAAGLVRARWGLGAAPISNVLHLIEAHGVRVLALAAECREVDAFSFWADGGTTPFIIIGTHKTPERQVFDLAHELGHLVLHRDHGEPRGRPEEREANEFASAFLMPRDDVLVSAPRSPSFNDLVRSKHRWKVSVAALNYRMHQLQLTTDWHYHSLCVDLAKMGRDQEIASLPREQSQVLTKVLVHLREEGSSRADVARALHIPPADLDGLLGLLVVAAIEGQAEGGPQADRPRLRIVR